MASVPTTKGAGLGALGGMAARFALKAAFTMLLNSPNIVDYLAAEAYREENPGKEYDKLPVLERTLWSRRVQSVIRAASNTV